MRSSNKAEETVSDGHPEIGFYDQDEDLIAATREDSRGRVRLYRHPDTAVVLGRGSSPEVELKLDACVEDGVKLQRRRGGGCSVLLDPGNLVVSVTLPLPGFTGISRTYEELTDWLINGLEAAGVAGVHREGTSDLAVGDRKIGGSCIYRVPGLIYYSTTLLVDPDIDLVERYLEHPPREPEYRRRRPHREFMTSLKEISGISDIRGFLDAFNDGLGPLP